jgi:uncharacterized membrane protein
MIVLAYLWPLAIVPLVVEKEDSEVQWHAKHGLVMMIAELIVLLGFAMLTSLISIATFGVGCVLGIFVVFIWIAIVAVHAIAIVKGINGTRLIVPGVSEYANRF